MTKMVLLWFVAAVPALGAAGKVGFVAVLPESTRVDFTNVISPERYTTNQILLNGSGVAAGDVDGDGWCDLFFAGLGGKSALYRNRGAWKFEKVTAEWRGPYDATGTALADLDGDGDLDLVVNSVGQGTFCFWNDGRGRFGTAPLVLNQGRCGSSLALADVDGDGALDLYIANYRTSTIRDQPGARFTLKTVNGLPQAVAFGGRALTEPDLTNRFAFRFKPGPGGGGSVVHDELGEADALYRNQGNGRFVPMTNDAVLDLDWGLSVMMRDFNGDGAPDIYVCNDFATPDRFWLNDGKGHFRPAPVLAMRQMSLSTMAIDVADINRDGFDDVFAADMLSRERWRRLVQHNEPNPNIHWFVDVARQPQSPRNTLQLNRGDGTYAEIAQLAGVEAAEWAWASIFLDVDLDGYEDLLVANGFELDYMNMDANRKIKALHARAGQQPTTELLKLNRFYPRLATANVAFRNLGNLRFADFSVQWGFDQKAVSQGMCLADLDNDGDLDVVINNSNGAATLLRNDATAPRVAVRLKGRAPNTRGIGARIKLLNGPVPTQSQEMISGGRYLSSDDSMRVFAATTNDMTIDVIWRSGARALITNIVANRTYEIEESGAMVGRGVPAEPFPAPMFKDVSALIAHTHTQDTSDDFARQPLLPNKLTSLELCAGWVDVDRDGRDDLILTEGTKRTVLRNGGHGGFLPFTNQVEELPPGPQALADLDGDGQLELFVGARFAPGRWPEAAPSQMFRHTAGQWTVDNENTKRLANAGLVSGAVFTDIDGDADSDLVLACEWGPLRVFRNERRMLTEVTAELGLQAYTGWWNAVSSGDFDGDGRLDLIASNWGRNTKYERFRSKPLRLYYGNFNGDGGVAMMESGYDEALRNYAPILNVWTLSRGMPWLLERFNSYEAFSRANVEHALAGRTINYLEANWLDSTVFLNRGGRFEAVPLPIEAQMAPAFGVCVADFDGDGNEDAFLSQNFFGTRAETSRYDAGRGLLLRGDGRRGFTAITGEQSGLLIYGEQRGAAAGDYDGDGRVDLVVTQVGSETKLYRNETARPGLRVRLPGQAVGAVVRLRFADKLGPAREIHSGSQDSAVQVMTGQRTPTAVQVKWPGGKVTATEIPPGARELSVTPK